MSTKPLHPASEDGPFARLCRQFELDHLTNPPPVLLYELALAEIAEAHEAIRQLVHYAAAEEAAPEARRTIFRLPVVARALNSMETYGGVSQAAANAAIADNAVLQENALLKNALRNIALHAENTLKGN